jgi:pimeloyl-ACP methyl ester carboxylesterase
MKKKKIFTAYGIWGSTDLLSQMNLALADWTQKETSTISYQGHDGDPFTPEMGKWTLKEYRQQMLERLPEGRVTIVGHSMSAMAAYQLAQQHPDKIDQVILIDPPMTGGLVDWRVAKAFLQNPKRYLGAMIFGKPFCVRECDARMMLFNGDDSKHISSIVNQPGSGRLVAELSLTPASAKKSLVPTTVIIAGSSRLHPVWSKKLWANAIGADCLTVPNASHCGIVSCLYTIKKIASLVIQ